MTDTFAPVVVHPLEPLTPQEISRTSAIVVRERNLTSTARFVYIELLEPTKADLQQSDTDRRAFVVLRDRDAHAAVEAERGQQFIGATPISARLPGSIAATSQGGLNGPVGCRRPCVRNCHVPC
ncbi:hypothetical protein CH302_04120 [Rhodococcus sp. 15-2388-1-1a]|uniref:hypothetical protein n=1 Tax=Nocardiaceae TaxID=85025 RepID=UPI0009E7EBE4|nr:MULTISPECIES: hypothetical protein [Rhodococcus]OZF02788.1 hypothetical protein CH302_04120 [Rhodococcus sp. 15-2388-1-1a]